MDASTGKISPWQASRRWNRGSKRFVHNLNRNTKPTIPMKQQVSHLIRIKNTVALLMMLPLAVSNLSAQMGLEDFSFEEIGQQLKLSDEQMSQLQAIQTAHSEKAASLKSRLDQANDQKSRKALVDDIRKLKQAAMAEVQGVLTSDQFDAFQVQLTQLRAIKKKEMQNETMADMQERLGLSYEQVADIQPLMAVYQPQISALMDELNQASGFRQKRKVGSKAKEIREELDQAIKEILTAGQYAEWEVMGEERRAKIRETMLD